MPSEAKSARNQQIVLAYISGATMQQIAEQHQISKERVRQLLNKNGITSRNYKPRRRTLLKIICRRCNKPFESPHKKQFCSCICHSLNARDKVRRFTDAEIKQVYDLYYKDNLPGTKIAKRFGVTYSAIYHILSGRSYKEIR